MLLGMLPFMVSAQLQAELPDLIISTELDSLACKIYDENDSTYIVELEYNDELQEAIVQKAFVYKVIRNYYVTGEKPPLDFDHSTPEVSDLPETPKMPIKSAGVRMGIRAGFAYRLSNQPISYHSSDKDVNDPLRSGYFTEVSFDYYLNETMGVGIHHVLNRSSVTIGDVGLVIFDQNLNPIATYQGTWQEQITMQTLGLNLMARTITLDNQLEVIGYGSIMYARIEDKVSNIIDSKVIGDNVAFAFGFDANYYIRHNLLFNMGLRTQLGQIEKGRTETSDPLLKLTINNDQVKTISRFDIGAGFIFCF
jgi:hypothetical protein